MIVFYKSGKWGRYHLPDLYPVIFLYSHKTTFLFKSYKYCGLTLCTCTGQKCRKNNSSNPRNRVRDFQFVEPVPVSILKYGIWNQFYECDCFLNLRLHIYWKKFLFFFVCHLFICFCSFYSDYQKVFKLFYFLCSQ
jgi:hypothetical protein